MYGVMDNIGHPHVAFGVIELILTLVSAFLFYKGLLQDDEIPYQYIIISLSWLLMHFFTFIFLFFFFISLLGGECMEVLLEFNNRNVLMFLDFSILWDILEDLDYGYTLSFYYLQWIHQICQYRMWL